MTLDGVYKIGRIGKTHGLKGFLTFFFDDDIFDRADVDFLVLRLDGLLVPFFIEEYRFQSEERALIKFDSIDTVEQAIPLVNAEVFFPKNVAIKSSDNLSLPALVGFTIYDRNSNKTLAPISSINSDTDNPLFELSDGTLIPIAEEWIKDIDKEKQLINMTLPEGLLSL